MDRRIHAMPWRWSKRWTKPCRMQQGKLEKDNPARVISSDEMPRHIPVHPPCQSGTRAMAGKAQTVVDSPRCPLIFVHVTTIRHPSGLHMQSVKDGVQLDPRIQQARTKRRQIQPVQDQVLENLFQIGVPNEHCTLHPATIQ